jgi:hypothetical protein
MRWPEFAACQPTLAAVAHDQLIRPGVALISATRRDGSAQISGVEPLIMDGESWLSTMPTSTKAPIDIRFCGLQPGRNRDCRADRRCEEVSITARRPAVLSRSECNVTMH